MQAQRQNVQLARQLPGKVFEFDQQEGDGGIFVGQVRPIESARMQPLAFLALPMLLRGKTAQQRRKWVVF